MHDSAQDPIPTESQVGIQADYFKTASKERLLSNQGAAQLTQLMLSKGIVLRELDGKFVDPDEFFFLFLQQQGAPADTDENGYYNSAWHYHLNNPAQANPYEDEADA